MIDWDGVERHRLAALLREGQMKNLRGLIEEGGFEALTIDGHATDTKAGWAEILTGYGPDVTGVHGNRQYRPIPSGLRGDNAPPGSDRANVGCCGAIAGTAVSP